eukprot:jgi/Botrbrau1/21625/Bobra.43_1s0027.1
MIEACPFDGVKFIPHLVHLHAGHGKIKFVSSFALVCHVLSREKTSRTCQIGQLNQKSSKNSEDSVDFEFVALRSRRNAETRP